MVHFNEISATAAVETAATQPFAWAASLAASSSQ
jgi:hypothetical protein